ncbi:MAG: RNA polymerase sigma factor [Armatimonadetes bacterium]|nr:RNA polymerase sigma factor [Armatimonadota bacterium]
MEPTIDLAARQRADHFDRLFAEHQKVLFSYLLGQCGRRDEAEDLLQQVFVRVWRHIGEAMEKPETAMRPWLFAIASNLVVDHRRRKRTRKDLEHAMPFEVVDGACGPDKVVEMNDSMRRLDEAIGRLPEEWRTSFTMNIVGGMSSEEIGKALGKPAGTIRYHVSEARQRLAKEMER